MTTSLRVKAGQARKSNPLPPVISEGPGTIIGRYKLLEKIGEGGCGVVYMAEQEEPVRRRVALKVIKLGMDTQEVIARFEAERQALAMMDHPNIAQGLRWRARPRHGPALLCDGTGAGRAHHRLLRSKADVSARATARSFSSRSARPSSTRIKRESFTATSNLRTFWSTDPRRRAGAQGD